jgi:prepilin-type N-terminal cleavage/methylation domain-containing protein
VKRKAFTLIELLVVIAIIALLLSIILPALKRVKETAKRTICATHQKGIGQGIFVYAQNNADLLPVSQYRTNGIFYNDTGLSRGTGYPSSSYMGFFINTGFGYQDDLRHVTDVYGLGDLFTSGVIDTGEVFYCTSTPKPEATSGWAATPYDYKSYCDAGGNWPWIDEKSGWNAFVTRFGYNYVPQAAGTRQAVGSRSFPEIATKSSQLQSSYVLVCDLLFDLKNLPHKKGNGQRAGGVNALFSDGSVQFRNDGDAFSPDLWGTTVQTCPGNVEVNFRTILQLLQ